MKAELMRYRNEKLAYYLCLFGLVFDVCYLIGLYSASGVTAKDSFGKVIGIDILFNIMFMLIAFLTAEKIKTYTLNWCFVALGLGVLQLPRILLPIKLFQAAQLGTASFVLLVIFLLLSAASLIASCVLSFINSHKLDNYLKEINAKR